MRQKVTSKETEMGESFIDRSEQFKSQSLYGAVHREWRNEF